MDLLQQMGPWGMGNAMKVKENAKARKNKRKEQKAARKKNRPKG